MFPAQLPPRLGETLVQCEVSIKLDELVSVHSVRICLYFPVLINKAGFIVIPSLFQSHFELVKL